MAGTDAHIGSTVKARVRHEIDRGGSAQSARHLVLALVSERESNLRLLQGRREGVHSTVIGKEEKGNRWKENNSPGCTVITHLISRYSSGKRLYNSQID